MARQFEFDVALSYAGENRDYVRQVARALEMKGVSVFFDEFNEGELWGEDLVEQLHDIYRSRARYCVIFISSHYASKAWPTHEKRSAFERALGQDSPYILPARFDDTILPGLPATIGYISLSDKSPEEVANLVHEKIIDTESEKQPDRAEGIRKPRKRPRRINPYDEVQSFLSMLSAEMKKRSPLLEDADSTISVFDRGDRLCIRVVDDGQAVYSLDAWPGAMTSDTGVSFYATAGEIRSSSGAITAWADFVWNPDLNQPTLDLNDFSLFGSPHGGSKQIGYMEFIDRVWNLIVNELDRRGL
jgi:hypothetical protein